MSIFSPPISDMTVVTRTPLCPTSEPTGSICSSFEETAIFEREPASRATAFTSIVPVPSSGDSDLKSSSKNFG